MLALKLIDWRKNIALAITVQKYMDASCHELMYELHYSIFVVLNNNVNGSLWFPLWP